MALNPQERAEFVNAFTRLLITAWSSEEFSARLVGDPRSALAEVGLEVPANAEIVLDRSITGQREGNMDGQVALWEEGLATGRFELHVPETPQIDTAELSESDLDAVAAGSSCCCCPCTCTS